MVADGGRTVVRDMLPLSVYRRNQRMFPDLHGILNNVKGISTFYGHNCFLILRNFIVIIMSEDQHKFKSRSFQTAVFNIPYTMVLSSVQRIMTKNYKIPATL